MIDPASITQRLIAVAEPVVAGAGLELVDVEYTRAPIGWVVRVYIDRSPDAAPGTPPVGLGDCERLSRELSIVFDVEDPVPHAYSLEVSSPGLDRPLRTPQHFQSHLGQTAKVMLSAPQAGRKNFKGELVELDGDTLLMNVDGAEFRLPLCDIASARLVPDWDRIMKGPSTAPSGKTPRKQAKRQLKR